MKIRHVPLHAEDFLSAVVGEMSPAELGLYWMICLLIYNRGKPIPDDINWLRHKFARSPGLRTLQDTLDRLIESGRVIREGHELYVSRCLEELELATSRARAASENGARGGRPSNKNNGVQNQDGLQEEKLTELNLTEVKKDGRAHTRASAASYAFEGKIIHLTQSDLTKWRESFSAIEDLDAELRTIDAKFVDDGVDPRKWFGKAAAWLRTRHEKILKDRRSTNGSGFGAPGFA